MGGFEVRRVWTVLPKRTLLSEDGHNTSQADVRDTTYLPANDATVEARVEGTGRDVRDE